MKVVWTTEVVLDRDSEPVFLPITENGVYFLVAESKRAIHCGEFTFIWDGPQDHHSHLFNTCEMQRSTRGIGIEFTSDLKRCQTFKLTLLQRSLDSDCPLSDSITKIEQMEKQLDDMTEALKTKDEKIAILQELLDHPENAGTKYGWHLVSNALQQESITVK